MDEQKILREIALMRQEQDTYFAAQIGILMALAGVPQSDIPDAVRESVTLCKDTAAARVSR